MIKRLTVALVVAASVLLLSSGGDTDASATASLITNSTTAGGAEVTATLVIASSGDDVLRVTIAPVSLGYHIYSLALPPDGVAGLGVPTHISVSGAFLAVDKPTTGAKTQYLRIAALGVALPVYPDGPVTLAMRVAHRGSGPTTVIASYGLCSDTRCMLPVEGLEISLGSD